MNPESARASYSPGTPGEGRGGGANDVTSEE
jgi:hypothetical protein